MSMASHHLQPELALNMTKSQMSHTMPNTVQSPSQIVPGAASQLPSTLPANKTEMNDALWYWLQQTQQVAMMRPNSDQRLDPKLANNLDKDGNSWFWRWYKTMGYSQFPDNSVANQADSLLASANQSTPLTNNARLTLDSVMLNHSNNNNNHHNNNNVSKRKLEESDDDEPPDSPAEAVVHGEKFLRWLECCSDPSVTAMQILQFRYLLNNVRACANRRAKQGQKSSRSRSRRK